MKVSDLAKKLNMKVETNITEDKEITNCYICDMLSFVMSKANVGDAWITIQTNINVVAVASLVECACVIIPEDVTIEELTIDKANKQGVTILSSNQSAFKIALEMGKYL